MPGTVLGADDTVVNETSKVTAPWSWQSQVDLRRFYSFPMKCDEYIVEDVSRVAQTTPKLGDSLEGLYRASSIQSASVCDLLQQKDIQ